MNAVMDNVTMSSISRNGNAPVHIEISGPSAMPDSQNDLKVKAVLELLNGVCFDSYMKNGMVKEYVDDVDALKAAVEQLESRV